MEYLKYVMELTENPVYYIYNIYINEQYNLFLIDVDWEFVV